MQSNRSKKIVGLALEERGNASLNKKVNIIEEKSVLLDEKTGKFVFINREAYNIEVNQPSCSYVTPTNVVLDEKTGMIIPIPQDCDVSSSETELSDSGSDFNPQEYDYSTSSEAETSCRILDEFSGTVKMKRARKGQGNKKNWTRNRLKAKRMKGQEYVSIKRRKTEGIIGWEKREQKKMLARCDSEKCAKRSTKKCKDITDVDRKAIFDSFWNLSWEERKAYVIAMVNCKSITAQTTGQPSRRMNTLEYSLKVAGENKPVCKQMFCGTLCLGEWSVLNWAKSAKNEIGMADKSHKAPKKQKPINVTKVKHVELFFTALPKMPAHYCRESNSKDFVDVNYTTWTELYGDFEKHLSDNNVQEKEKPTYKCFLDVAKKMNIGLYRPKKDQCDVCYAYKNKNVSEEVYEAHRMARKRARQEKEGDKLICSNGGIHMLTLDLQAVQSIPNIVAGAQYFKLKLSVHQFTIYNEHDKSVVCYVWHESEGGMDSNVFTSCLVDYLEGLEDKYKLIVIYSDGCSAQNRNVTLANALQNFAITHNAEIHQKYLVVGHTQMECDSVHATIERKKKGKELYVPADFVRIITQARSSPGPYQVKYLDHTFFRDFSSLNYMKSIRPGTKKGDPCVVDIRALKYAPVAGVHYKLNFDDDWSLLPQRICRQVNSSQIKQLYNHRIAINKRKYDDLQSLKQLIPADYHSFYDNLQHE